MLAIRHGKNTVKLQYFDYFFIVLLWLCLKWPCDKSLMSVCMCARFNEVSDTDHFLLHTQQCVLLLFSFSSALLLLLPVFLFCLEQMWSKCGIIDWKTPFSHTRQRSNCVVTVTGSNTNFHSWVMQLQINQTNRVFVFAISGPGCNISSTCSRAALAAREAQLFLRAPQWEIGWALADFSTMWQKLRWWAPEDCGSLILISSGHM